MKATLEFTLPEEDTEHRTALNGARYLGIIYDVRSWLRSALKYNDTLSKDTRRAYEQVQKLIMEAVDGAGVPEVLE